MSSDRKCPYPGCPRSANYMNFHDHSRLTCKGHRFWQPRTEDEAIEYEHQLERAYPRKRVIRNDIGQPYLTRYYLLRTRWLGIFIHRIHLPDDARAMHDHPWDFWAIPLRGSYEEQVPSSTGPFNLRRTIRRFQLNRKKATDQHRISWVSPDLLTLFIRFRRRRTWGFWPDRKTFIPWNEYHT